MGMFRSATARWKEGVSTYDQRADERTHNAAPSLRSSNEQPDLPAIGKKLTSILTTDQPRFESDEDRRFHKRERERQSGPSGPPDFSRLNELSERTRRFLTTETPRFENDEDRRLQADLSGQPLPDSEYVQIPESVAKLLDQEALDKLKNGVNLVTAADDLAPSVNSGKTALGLLVDGAKFLRLNAGSETIAVFHDDGSNVGAFDFERRGPDLTPEQRAAGYEFGKSVATTMNPALKPAFVGVELIQEMMKHGEDKHFAQVEVIGWTKAVARQEAAIKKLDRPATPQELERLETAKTKKAAAEQNLDKLVKGHRLELLKITSQMVPGGDGQTVLQHLIDNSGPDFARSALRIKLGASIDD